MPVRWALLLFLPALAGCVSGDAPNPNLLVPKVVVDVLPTHETSIFVHSQFSERRYDVIELRIDNESTATRTHAYSMEERFESTGFFLEVHAFTSGQAYEFRGRFDVNLTTEKVEVAVLDVQDRWQEPRSFPVPHSIIMQRTPEARP